jgi:hypothetical protein
MFGGAMTTAERVMDYLVRHKNRWLCDDCIATALNLPSQREIVVVTSAIGRGPDYSLHDGTCSECARPKLAIRAR